MKQIKITLDGKPIKVDALKVGNTLWIHHDGECFAIEKQDSRQKRRALAGAAAAESGEIHAPMPGKISKVLVKKSQNVQAKEILIVMEAMKMEYTLKAAITGTVQDVLCQEGQQVALGELLVKLEKATK
ncbi:MAG: acetyl-CoA carboxylase biotin carboxyl carrier protein subunit [Bdellovibrionales bacterium]|nr:acetyl-CoA carboxylase biotin carboxyl carrier protein subunit [Bdellovibrionales bacterium]